MRIAILILAFLIAACERPGPDAPPDGAGTDADLSRPASYERRFAFVAGAQAAPIVAFYDFASVYDGARLHRAARGWLREDQRWAPFLDEAWDTEPMRAPWRLVPHGELRIVVGDDDDVEVLIQRGAETEVRLAAGIPLAAASPDHGVQLSLRLAELQVGAERFAGAVLDAQTARVPAPAHRLAAPVATAEQENGTASDGSAADGGPHTDGPPGVEAFLTDGARLYVVVARSPAEASHAWVRDAGDERTWEGARIEPIGAAGRTSRWRIVAPPNELAGQLESLGPILAAADAGPFAGLVDVLLVRGSVELAAERRPVFGLLWRSHD